MPSRSDLSRVLLLSLLSSALLDCKPPTEPVQAASTAAASTAAPAASATPAAAADLSLDGALPSLAYSPVFGEQLGTQCSNCTADRFHYGTDLGLRYLRITQLDLANLDLNDVRTRLETIWATGAVPILIIFWPLQEADKTLARFDQFAATAATVAQAFAGRPLVWEIWNEPHNENFWHNPDPNLFAALAVRIARSLKQTIAQTSSPQFVIGDAISAGQPPKLAFFQQALSAQPDLLGLLDAVSVHGYLTIDDTASNNPPEDLNLVFSAIRRLTGSKPVILSEYGWNQSLKGMTPKLKADFSARLLLMHDIVKASGTILYDLIDYPTDPVGGAGLLDRNGVPRPAYTEVQHLIAMLRGYTYVRQVIQGNNYVVLYRPVTGGRERAIFWTKNGKAGSLTLISTAPGKKKAKVTLTGLTGTPKMKDLAPTFQ